MNNDMVIVKLDKVRHMKLTNKAMKMLEKTFKANISEVLKRMDSLSIDEMTTIIHAGLIHEDKDLNYDVVEELLDEHCTLGDMLKLIVEAFKLAMGVEEEESKTKMSITAEEGRAAWNNSVNNSGGFKNPNV